MYRYYFYEGRNVFIVFLRFYVFCGGVCYIYFVVFCSREWFRVGEVVVVERVLDRELGDSSCRLTLLLNCCVV